MSVFKKISQGLVVCMLFTVIIICYYYMSTNRDRFHYQYVKSAKLIFDNNDTLRQKSSVFFQTNKLSENHHKEAIHICDINSASWLSSGKKYNVPMDEKEYFWNIGKLDCLKEGTDFSEPIPFNETDLSNCKCKIGWYGKHCTIPASVKYSNLPLRQEIIPIVKTHNNPIRRVINAFPFNIEFDMLEARFQEIGDLVDAFLILESNYTAYGDPKPLYLLERLKRGYYRHVSCKIIHVFLNYFPAGARTDGGIAERLNRNFIGTQGLQNQVSGISDDDILILNDADELPSREVLLFLKLHRGYPEPISIQYKHLLYGFFWQMKWPIQNIDAVVTIKFAKEVLKYEIVDIRIINNLSSRRSKIYENLQKYKTFQKHPVIMWEFGSHKTKWQSTVITNSGWHCSWCFNPKGIHNKLVSAQNGDFPRWGDYPAKRNLTYIASLIKEGKYFDGNTPTNPSSPLQKYYVPKYFLDNFEKYAHLLKNPYI